MKTAYKLLLLLSIFSSTVLPIELTLTPENTVVVSDLDRVLLQQSFLLRTILQLKHLVSDDTNEKNEDVSGLTFYLLYHGMQKPYLSSYISWILKNIEHLYSFNDGTEKIYRYLKDVKGYSITYATNKDRISYDICAQALGNKFTSLPSKAFVAHPGNNTELLDQLKNFANLPTTPASYKELLQKALSIQPTEIILHVPNSKPNVEYYQYMEKNIDPDKNIIFIDDLPENIIGFNELKKTAPAQRIGIVFKNPQQLAQEFVNMGILSETDDAQLLEDIRYPGIWEKIKLFVKKLFKMVSRDTQNNAGGLYEQQK